MPKSKKPEDASATRAETQTDDAPEYSSHAQQFRDSLPSAERLELLEKSLLEAYRGVIEYQTVPFIRFGDLNALELAAAFVAHPLIVKPTLCCVNVAQRAIIRDLGVSIDTYSHLISEVHAIALASYIKPLLPPAMAVHALLELDRYFWTDKEMRARKGSWEVTITRAISSASKMSFKKRKFLHGEDRFEIDAAYPDAGDTIEIAIDVKRIEAQRDIHKRSDEIVNKAAKFKSIFPNGLFFAVVYFPFVNQQINLKTRLSSEYIDGLFFAGESQSSIDIAADLLAGSIKAKTR